MSQVMMSVLQQQVASLSKQVERLVPENERVRKLLTEFDIRHDRDLAEIERMKTALNAIEWQTATGEGLDPDETINIHVLASVGRDDPTPQKEPQQ